MKYFMILSCMLYVGMVYAADGSSVSGSADSSRGLRELLDQAAKEAEVRFCGAEEKINRDTASTRQGFLLAMERFIDERDPRNAVVLMECAPLVESLRDTYLNLAKQTAQAERLLEFVGQMKGTSPAQVATLRTAVVYPWKVYSASLTECVEHKTEKN